MRYSGNSTTIDTLDRIGVAASCACAIHCAVMPFVIGLLPLVGLGWFADERIEWALIASSLMLGATSLLPAYFRHHHKPAPLLLLSSGVTLIVIARLLFAGDWRVEAPGVVCGAMLIAAAHWVNRRCCRACCAVG